MTISHRLVDADMGQVITSTVPTKYATLLPLIGLELSDIAYGSLDLTLDITGAKNLVDLFDRNFDLFMMFMRGYLPTAFLDSLSELDLPRDFNFRFGFEPTQTLISAFAAPTGASVAPPASATLASAPANPDRLDRMKAAWLVTNYTLLVPVLLSLVVVYVAAKGLDGERSELQATRNELSSREQAIVKLATDRSMELEKSQSELIKTLKSSPQPAETK